MAQILTSDTHRNTLTYPLTHIQNILSFSLSLFLSLSLSLSHTHTHTVRNKYSFNIILQYKTKL